MKRGLTAVAMTAILALGLTACAPSGDGESGGSSEEGKLVVWSSWLGVQADLIREYTAKFEEENGVEVELVEMSSPDIKQKIQAAAVSGDLPDVFQHWGGPSYQSIVDGGTMLALDDYIAGDPEWEGQFIDSWAENFTYNGGVYGVPIEAPVVQLFYNTELLSDAGVTTPPQTFDELLAAVEKLKASGVIPITVNGVDGWPMQQWFYYLAMRNGGVSIVNDAVAGTVDWTDPAFVQAGEQLRQLIDVGAFQEGFLGEAYDQDIANFTSQQAGMILMGTWILGNLSTEENAAALANTSFTAFPTTGGTGSATELQGGPNASWHIGGNSANADLAWKYISGITSNDEASRVATEALNIVPNVIDIDPASVPAVFNDLSTSVSEASGFAFFMNGILDPDFNTEVVNALNALVAGEITPQEMMEQIQAAA
jgi:raffinose/stachyose/melibiose transport system substrate-binding protein